MRYDLAGAVGLSTDPEVGPRITRYVRGAMVPYVPSALPTGDSSGDGDGAGVLRLESLEVGPRPWLDVERSAGDGLTTAWDGDRAYVLSAGRCCAVPDPLRDEDAAFALEPGFPLGSIWASLVSPALSVAALRRDAAVLHSSAVAVGGRAVLVAGWSESGKTEVALALAETGAAFMSDKWSILNAGGSVAPFPASVGVRRWVVPYLPRLSAGLTAAARAQLAGARVAAALARPLRDRTASGPIVRELSSAASSASDIADRIPMTSAAIRRIYGVEGDQCLPVPLAAVVLLTTAPTQGRVSLEPMSAETMARRLSQSAAFERRAYFSVAARISYATDHPVRASAEEGAEIERGVLTRLLSGVPLFQARTDFPQDPRPLAGEIREALVRIGS